MTYSTWKTIKSEIPEGQSGDWKIEKFIITEEDAKRYLLRSQIHIVMSDTPAEIEDLWQLQYHAKGNILISGLGLGIALQIVLAKPLVFHVTVVEIEPDVIDLVGSYFIRKYAKRVKIIRANAFDWNPPKKFKYDVVWHDIWDDICTDNLAGMTKLRRKYCRRADWQGFWAYEDHLRAKRRWG
jgi:spermidine synthase